MEPAVFTLHDLWTMFLTICGAICTVAAAAVIVIKIIEHFKKPNKTQDERIDALESSVDKIEEKLKSNNDRMAEYEVQLKQSTNVIIESLQALTANAIDGNNIEELRVAKKKMDTYLLNR